MFALSASRAAELPGPATIMLVIGIIAVITYTLRVIPFLAVHKLADSQIVSFLGRTMPLGVLLILVIYTVAGTDVAVAPFGLPELASIAITAGLHLWLRNVLISLVGGTGSYIAFMALL